MASVDERVVEMRFQNGQFERGIAQTTRSLKDFKNNLDLKGATAGLSEVSKAAGNVKLGSIAGDVGSLNSKISLFGVAAATAMSKLTSSAIGFGAKLASNVLDPMVEGGKKRAQNIAQAKFMLSGLFKDVPDSAASVEKAMQAANNAVTGTAFGLDEAAMAASSFVASNVGLDDLESALTGISGVAAMTGRDYTSIAQIFTTVAGNGRLMASELNRIGASGLNAAAALAKYLGVTESEVRDMTSKGKIDFNTFAAAMNDAFGDQAKKANDLYTGSLANVRAALARIGEIPAEGKFEKMRLIFNALAPKIDAVKKAIEPLLNLYKELSIASGKRMASWIKNIDLTDFEGGMKNISAGIKNLVKIGSSFAKRFSAVWKLAFPKSTTTWFTSLTGVFLKLTKAITPSTRVLNLFSTAVSVVLNVVSVLGAILKGVWSILKAGVGVIVEIIGLLFDLIKPFLEMIGVSTDTTNAMGDFFDILRNGIGTGAEKVVQWLNDFRKKLEELRKGGSSGNKFFDILYKSIKKFNEFASGKIGKFFTGLKDAIKGLVSDGSLLKKVQDFFSSFSFSNVNLSGLQSAADTIMGALGTIVTYLKKAWDAVSKYGDNIKGGFTSVVDFLKDIFKNISGNDILLALQTGGLIAAFVMIYKTVKQVNSLMGSFEGLVTTFTESILSADKKFNKIVKLGSFLAIAAGIYIIAMALVKISQVPIPNLIAAGLALAVIATGLLLMFKAVDKMAEAMTPEKAARMTSISIVLLVLAASIGILAISVKKLSEIDIDKLVAGTLSLVAIMLGLATAVRIMAKDQAVMLRTSFAILTLAGSLWIFAAAIERFADIPKDDLIKGGITAATAILLLSGAMTLMSMPKNNANILKAATAITVMVGTLWLLAGAIKKFADMDGADIAKGGTLVAVALGGLALVATALSKKAGGSLAGAGAIAIMVGSIHLLVGALKKVADMPSEDIIVKLTAMVAAIGLLAIIANMLNDINDLGGVLAVVVLAASLLILSLAINSLADVETGKLFAIVGALSLIMVVVGVLGIILAQFPIAVAAIFAIAAVIGAIGLVIGAIGFVIQSAANLILAGIQALQFFIDNTPQLVDSLMQLAQGAEQIEPYVGVMIKAGGAMLILGAGAFGAGIGLALLGVGLITVAAGLALLAIFAPIGMVALESMVTSVSGLVEYAGDLAIMGLSLLALGAGMIVAGVGGLIGALGAWAMSAALQQLAPAAASAAPAMVLMANAAKASVGGILPLIGLGVGLAAFGAGAMVAGIGSMLLGTGLLLMGRGLLLAAAVGPAGASALVGVAESLSPLWKNAVKLGIVAVTFTTLGIGIGVLGGAMLIAAAGTIAFSTAIMIFQIAAPMFLTALATMATGTSVTSQAVATALARLAEIVGSSSAQVVAAISQLASAVVGSFGAISSAFLQLGIAMMTAVGQGIQSGMGAAQSIALMVIMMILLQMVVRIASSAGQFMSAGRAVGTAFSAGIAATAGVAGAAANVVVKAVVTILRLGAVGATLAGVLVVTSFSRGVSAGRGAASSAGRSVGNSFTSGLRGGLSSAQSIGYSGGLSVGFAIANGAQAGVNIGSWGVVAAVRAMAREAVAAAKAELDVRSPSRVFNWIGQMVGAGAAQGIDTSTEDVVDSTKNMGATAINTMKKAVSQIDSVLDLDPNMSPTIKPILDLSEVEKNSKNIGSLLDAQPLSANVSANMAATNSNLRSRNETELVAAQGNGGNTYYNFEQKIESPRALSTVEIYRQTNNLVSRAKRAGEDS